MIINIKDYQKNLIGQILMELTMIHQLKNKENVEVVMLLLQLQLWRQELGK